MPYKSQRKPETSALTDQKKSKQSLEVFNVGIISSLLPDFSLLNDLLGHTILTSPLPKIEH